MTWISCTLTDEGYVYEAGFKGEEMPSTGKELYENWLEALQKLSYLAEEDYD